ncbi:hypothetical protein ABPG74_005931 [Tetrahymena malaccensis]
MSAIYKYLIRPYFLYRKYRKYGDGYFFPLFGEIAQYSHNVQKYQDSEYSFKHYFDNRKPEDNRIFVSNIGNLKLNNILLIIKIDYNKNRTICQNQLS